MHQIRFRLGSPIPLGQVKALSQTPQLDLKGPTSGGRKERKDGRNGKGVGRREGHASKASGNGGRKGEGGYGSCQNYWVGAICSVLLATLAIEFLLSLLYSSARISSCFDCTEISSYRKHIVDDVMWFYPQHSLTSVICPVRS